MEELKSVFECTRDNVFVGYFIFKYEEKDRTDPRCVVAGVPLAEARRYKFLLLDK
jgi:hypothetical protein